MLERDLMNIIKEKLKNLKYRLNFKYRIINSRKFYKLTEKEIRYALEIQFEKKTGYKLNLDNPKTFSEKIQWLKLLIQLLNTMI